MWSGRTASAVGDSLMPVTVTFTVLSVGGSASDIGLVLATTMVARMVLLIFGGVLADRLPRRLLLMGSDVFLFCVQTVVGILLLQGHKSVGMLLVAALCYGAASAISKPALIGIVPQTVSNARLQQANALMELSKSGAEILGPAVAGATVALASPGWVYLLDAATFLVSAVTVIGLQLAPMADREPESFLKNIVGGWREMAARTWYWGAVCCHGVWNVGSCAFYVLGPAIVATQTGGAASWGLVSASMAGGAVVGSAVALRVQPRRPLVAAHVALLLVVLQLSALIGPSPTGVIMAAGFVSAAGIAYANNLWTTSVQRLIPEKVLSRVNSYDWLVSFAVAPLGYGAVGPLSEKIGNAATLEIALVIVIAAATAIMLVPGIRALQQTRSGALEGWPELAARGDA